MKIVLTLTSILLAATVSQAKTFCSVNASDPQKSPKSTVFDRVLFNAEIQSPKYLLVNKEASSATEIQLGQLTTPDQWKALDGRTLVIFSRSRNDVFTIIFGQIDISKASTNLLTTEAAVVGSVIEKSPLTLIIPSKNMSALCFVLN